MAINGDSSLLGRLRTVVKKVRYLMNVNVIKWRLASMIGGASLNKRRLSFKDMPEGLTILTAEDEDDYEGSDLGSSSGRSLQKTMSFASDEDDVDKRAEMFISNFYKQLRMERQVSLELRYLRGNSFGSNSNSSSP